MLEMQGDRKDLFQYVDPLALHPPPQKEEVQAFKRNNILIFNRQWVQLREEARDYASELLMVAFHPR